ncbi:hypothetical protein M0R45_037282 [Rubus argutus]|uniref:RRM domain-containing protein n=1 Tax=Rubus argutus TaxID=59490 RepID=A0AAW1VYP9_RUBAR
MPTPQESLDMSLADLIVTSKQHRQNVAAQRRGHNGHSGGGGGFSSRRARRPMNRNAARTAPYSTQPKKMQVAGPRRIELPRVMSEGINTEGGTKLYISNLDYDVTNRDIELLFSEVGDLERHSIHYDKSGRSKGTAEVVYVHHSDAVAAIERYNNQLLDGKQMEIKLVGLHVVASVPVPPNQTFLQEKPNLVFQRLGRAGSKGSFDGRGGLGLERGRGQVRKGGEKVTTGKRKNVTSESHNGKNIATKSTFYGDTKVTFEDLDADLEKYRLDARPEN